MCKKWDLQNWEILKPGMILILGSWSSQQVMAWLFDFFIPVLREHRHLRSDERVWTRMRADFLDVGEGKWKKIVSESGD